MFVVSLVLVVVAYTTACNPNPDPDSKTQNAAQPAGCCCGIEAFQPQLLRRIRYIQPRSAKTGLFQQNRHRKTESIYGIVEQYCSSAGQRTRVPPDPIPNSEVKPCSVSSCSVVLGHVNLGKLATSSNYFYAEFSRDLA